MDLKKRIVELESLLQRTNEDWAEDDAAIRELARPYMNVDGNSYFVPSVVDIVKELIEQLEEKELWKQ